METDNPWTEVYTGIKEYKILLIQGMLEENGILTFVLNTQDSMYGFGDIKLMVRRSEILRAKQLIVEHQNENNE